MLGCYICDTEYEDRTVEDSLEAVKADATPMFLAYRDADEFALDVGRTDYCCSPECMREYLAEVHDE